MLQASNTEKWTPKSLQQPRHIFEYKPTGLDEHEIRLVVLQPIQNGVPCISCRLIRARHGTLPYKALSYTWGPVGAGLDERAILLNGAQFMVGRNLWWALYHLCQLEGAANLWVDAICINQGNMEERNRQVRMMGEIYSGAQEVIVWLGNEDGESETALGLIKGLASSKFYDPFSAWSLAKLGSRWTFGSDWTRLQRCLESLLERPYWRRLWIVQEVVLAKDVRIYCGPTSMPWRYIATACDESLKAPVFWQRTLEPLMSLLRQSMPAFLERCRRDSFGDRSLIRLLHVCQDSRASDSRDMIYGLLGIANDCSSLEVDYSLSPHQLWRDLLRFQTTPQPFPSVTFSGDRKKSMYFSQLLWDVMNLSEHLSSLTSMPEGTIRFTGMWTSTVIQIGPSGSEMKAARHHAWKSYDKSQPAPAWNQDLVMSGTFPWDTAVLQEIDPMLSHAQALHIFSDDSSEHCNSATISLDSSTTTSRRIGIPFHKFPRATLAVTTLDETGHAKSTQLDTSPFTHYDFCTYVMTDQGQIGMTTPDARPGDLICQFHGCDVALVLRYDLSTGGELSVVARIMLFRKRGEPPQRREETSRVFRYAVPHLPELEFVDVECFLDARTVAAIVMHLLPVEPAKPH